VTLHLDFYRIPNRNAHNRIHKLKCIFDDVLEVSEDVPVLIVAGDIGHYNKENLEILEDLATLYNYKKVFAVLGNHDYYHSKRQTTAWRVQNYMEYNDVNGVVHLLFGDIIEYEGIRFGGTPGWYYSKDYLPEWSNEGRLRLWKNRMNDAHYIDGLTNPDDKFVDEYGIMTQVVGQCDIFINHVCPTIDKMIIERSFGSDDTNAFYCFDGSRLFMNSSVKVAVFGHSHDSFDGVLADDIRYVTNCLGYPQEKAHAMTIEV